MIDKNLISDLLGFLFNTTDHPTSSKKASDLFRRLAAAMEQNQQATQAQKHFSPDSFSHSAFEEHKTRRIEALTRLLATIPFGSQRAKDLFDVLEEIRTSQWDINQHTYADSTSSQFSRSRKTSASVKLSRKQWDAIHHIASTTDSTVGPNKRPSWRVMLRRIAEGSLIIR